MSQDSWDNIFLQMTQLLWEGGSIIRFLKGNDNLMVIIKIAFYCFRKEILELIPRVPNLINNEN